MCIRDRNTALWEVSARPSHGENAAARTRRALLLGRGRRASNAVGHHRLGAGRQGLCGRSEGPRETPSSSVPGMAYM
eukprot:6588366-Prymnesium_polylepis.1